MQRRQLRRAFDLPQGVVADQRGVFEAFAAVGDAVANAVYLLQAAQDPRPVSASSSRVTASW